MQIVFAFSFNTDTKEAALTGNIKPEVALNILQKLVIAEAIKKAQADDKKETKNEREE